MDEKYLKSLEKVRKNAPETFSQALYAHTDFEFCQVEAREHLPEIEPASLEKEQLIQSLEKHAKDKLKENDEYQFKGGSIAVKKPLPESFIEDIDFEVPYLSKKELIKLESDYYSQDYLNHKFSTNSEEQASRVRLMFLSHTKSGELQSGSSLTQKVSTLFEGEIASLFEKMVRAMGRAENEIFLSCLDKSAESKELVLKEILHFRPQFVVSLGAISTHQILDIKERLSQLHGQFFSRSMNREQVNEFEFRVCPLFHPEFLLINPNMKKTTWDDMQKMMKELN
jgi:uracil-DNA glycosylase family 4